MVDCQNDSFVGCSFDPKSSELSRFVALGLVWFGRPPDWGVSKRSVVQSDSKIPDAEIASSRRG